MPQASRVWLPNQNGHHARPAMNTQNSAPSTIALSADFVLAIPALEASVSPALENDAVRNDISAFRESPATRESDSDESVPDLRHVTTLRVNHRFTRPNGPHVPLKGRIDTHVKCLTKMARFTDQAFNHPDPL